MNYLLNYHFVILLISRIFSCVKTTKLRGGKKMEIRSTLYPAEWKDPKTGKTYTKEGMIEAINEGRIEPKLPQKITLVDPIKYSSLYVNELNKLRKKIAKIDFLGIDYIECSLKFFTFINENNR